MNFEPETQQQFAFDGGRGAGPGRGRGRGSGRQPVPPDTPFEKGIVVSTRENYGFVRSEFRPADVFFHFSEVTAPDGAPQPAPTPPEAPAPATEDGVTKTFPHRGHVATPHVAPGTCAEFQVVHNAMTGKLNAVNLRVLEPGSVSLERTLPDTYIGTVSAECASRSRGAHRGKGARGQITALEKAGGGALAEPAAPAEGAVPAPESPRLRDVFSYHVKDVVGPPPVAGQRVEFRVCEEKASGKRRAVGVTGLAAVVDRATIAGMERVQGFVAALKDTYGFVRCAGRLAQVFFHSSEVDGGVEGLDVGQEVSFVVTTDVRTGKDAAVSVSRLPAGTVTAEVRVPGVFKGRVVQASENQLKSWSDEDGRLLVEGPYVETPPPDAATEQQPDADASAPPPADADPPERAGTTAVFSGGAVAPGAGERVEPWTPGVGDEVACELWEVPALGVVRAVALRFLRRNPERGQILSLQPNFGFIRSAERALDVFFHMTSLEPPLKMAELAVGVDVSFSMGKDTNSGRPCALSVARAAKGSGAYQALSGGEFYGVCQETARAARAYGATGTAGLIEFATPDAPTERQLITYGAGDTAREDGNKGGLRPGEHVAFRIMTDLRHANVAAGAKSPSAELAGKRAVRVRPVRTVGRVCAVYESTGIIEVLVPDKAADAPRSGKSRRASTKSKRSSVGGAAGTEEGAKPSLPASAAGSATEEAREKEKAAAEPAGPGTARVGQQVQFHVSDLPPKVRLRVGDEVECVLTTGKGRDVMARQLVRTREGDEEDVAEANAAAPAMKATPPRLQHLKLAAASGGARPVTTARIAKGPDGTRGFALGRGKAIEAALHDQHRKLEQVTDAPEWVPPGAGADAEKVADADEAAQ
ncbi:unnamed protein product [Pedinophyceae sp. YPF-701]|nr:unnamed protein product [Pedinophyceae sp. YPF-701]